MKKVLILGAGLVAGPMVRYLLEKGYCVTVASNTPERAGEMIAGHTNGNAVIWEAGDDATLDRLIAANDLVVSLLPYVFHVMVAKHCIRHKKNMVTTSYVKPEMLALDEEAKKAGIIILNEIGLDPGIDHMSAMRIIHHIHNRGGKVEEFYSLCGALPAPEAASNPFRYKFSWSPKGVVMASNNDAKFMKKGVVVNIPTEDLFKKPLCTDFPGAGKMDIYPNRDSLSYLDIYGIPETKTMYRGTFRYRGWCESLDAMKACRLVSGEKQDFSGLTYAGFIAKMIDAPTTVNIRDQVAAFLGLPVEAYALESMQWLGLFEDTPMNRGVDTPFEITSDLMIAKMSLAKEERDMVAMLHIFLASYPDGTNEVIKSHMLDFGSQVTETAIARTVALPAATAVVMILSGKIEARGVHIPVIPEIYNPVLDNLEKIGIRMVEEYGLPIDEMFN